MKGRPGRCLADIEFTPLSTDEANVWLVARGRRERVDRPTTLAELFGRTSDEPPVTEDGPGASFGFARALDATSASPESHSPALG